MDSIVHFENDRFVGKTNFRSGLLTSLVVLSIKNVEGVERVSSDAWKFRRLFSRSLRHGVAVYFNFDGIVVDVCVWTKYGYTAADVCYRVQESVIDTISGLVEDEIKNVNVKIMGVARDAKGA